MKKSEALKILGLSDGATDDQVKAAHRKLVVKHHPDRCALGSPEREEAEELTKQINEARDVLLNRSWTPEFDPRRDPRPYAGNPYAHPSASSRSSVPQSSSEYNPFEGWPFTSSDKGRTTYVWTSWDRTQSSEGEGFSGFGFDFDPFDPFAPFRRPEPQKTSEQVRAEARDAVSREAGMVAIKAVLLVLASLFASPAGGLFFYVVASCVYGLWKRLGSCLIGFIVPLAMMMTPFILLIAPKEGAITLGLFVLFLICVAFDVSNLRTLIRRYRLVIDPKKVQ